MSTAGYLDAILQVHGDRVEPCAFSERLGMLSHAAGRKSDGFRSGFWSHFVVGEADTATWSWEFRRKLAPLAEKSAVWLGLLDQFDADAALEIIAVDQRSFAIKPAEMIWLAELRITVCITCAFNRTHFEFELPVEKPAKFVNTAPRITAKGGRI